jgi:hypothetical protein
MDVNPTTMWIKLEKSKVAIKNGQSTMQISCQHFAEKTQKEDRQCWKGEQNGRSSASHSSSEISGSAILFTNKCIWRRNIAFFQACQLQIWQPSIANENNFGTKTTWRNMKTSHLKWKHQTLFGFVYASILI